MNYQQDILPLFKKYCFDCHAGKDPEGVLAMDALKPVEGRRQSPAIMLTRFPERQKSTVRRGGMNARSGSAAYAFDVSFSLDLAWVGYYNPPTSRQAVSFLTSERITFSLSGLPASWNGTNLDECRSNAVGTKPGNARTVLVSRVNCS